MNEYFCICCCLNAVCALCSSSIHFLFSKTKTSLCSAKEASPSNFQSFENFHRKVFLHSVYLAESVYANSHWKSWGVLVQYFGRMGEWQRLQHVFSMVNKHWYCSGCPTPLPFLPLSFLSNLRVYNMSLLQLIHNFFRYCLYICMLTSILLHQCMCVHILFCCFPGLGFLPWLQCSISSVPFSWLCS